jgi:sodium-dependent phosphate cotransporter
MTLRRSVNSSPPSPDPRPGAVRGQGRRRAWRYLRRLLLFAAGVAVFTLGLILMKEGAVPVTPFLRSQLSVSSPASALGFGWILASLALSGSPVAATALSFFDAGALTPGETFAMITGSRLGATFVVVLLGFIYMVRGRSREGSLGAGLMSLLVTQSTYFPAYFVGLALLRSPWLQRLQVNAAATGNQVPGLLDPLFAAFGSVLPVWLLLPAGFLVLLLSFRLIDHALPDVHLENTRLGRINRLLYRPLVTFILGAAVTSVTLSVSLSLGLLIPLSARGYIRQENAIPYIMGANITTFIDTLVAAALLQNPTAVTVVFAEMLSVAFVSLLIMGIAFRGYERLLVGSMRTLLADRRRFAAYMIAILAIPIVLLTAL